MSDTEENEQIQENTSESLGEKQEVGNEDAKDGDDTKPSKKKPGAINKNGQPRKTLSPEQQKARLEVLKKGREKANIKRQLAKEEANKKKEYNPPAIAEQPPVKTVKVVKPKKKKTIVIEESSSESEDEVVVVKRVKKQSKPKQVEPLPMEPPPPRPPPRQETEADKKKKLMQLREDLSNKKIYKSLFG